MNKKIAVFAGNKCKKEKEDYYHSLAYETGRLLAGEGFITVTGGGPGLMNEALRGAFENNGETIGIRLNRPGRNQSEFVTNNFLFDKLGPRQEKFIEVCHGYIALPGGIGTLYEICMILALKKVEEMPLNTPFILIDPYFHPLKNLLSEMIQEGFIEEDILDLFFVVEKPKQAVEKLKEFFT